MHRISIAPLVIAAALVAFAACEGGSTSRETNPAAAKAPTGNPAGGPVGKAPTPAPEPASPTAPPAAAVPPETSPAATEVPSEPLHTPIQTASGLTYENLASGSGPVVKVGDTAVVHYTGWLTDGTKFDSSLDKNQPYPVTVGRSAVIKGWHEGLQGMQKGGKRKLTIPPELAYGPGGRPPVIPANATLVFEVEVVEIR